MSYIINNTSRLNWSNIFHCVHIYNTRWRKKKCHYQMLPPFGANKDRLPPFFRIKVKVSSTDCKSQDAQQCSSIQKCKSIIDVTKPCVCVVVPLCWLYNVESRGPAQTSLFTGEGVKRLVTHIMLF